jgi:hypothetical protein
MKHLFNDISREEKQRILEMHGVKKNLISEQSNQGDKVPFVGDRQSQPTPPTPVPPNQQGQSQPTPPTPEACNPTTTLKAKVFKDPNAKNLYTNIQIGERDIYGNKVKFKFNIAGLDGYQNGFVDCGSNKIDIGDKSPTYLGPVTTKKVTCICDEFMAKNKSTTSNQA